MLNFNDIFAAGINGLPFFAAWFILILRVFGGGWFGN